MSLDLDYLAEYLDGNDNENGLDFAATHGFLCATVVGPQLDDWMNLLFDGEVASLPAKLVEQLKLWQKDIQSTLNADELIEFPFEIEEADVESSLGDWAIGFVDAMFLNEKNDWFEVDEESVVMLTLPMMVFSGIDEDDVELQKMRRNGNLMDEMAEEIPENLTKLYLLYHSPES